MKKTSKALSIMVFQNIEMEIFIFVDTWLCVGITDSSVDIIEKNLKCIIFWPQSARWDLCCPTSVQISNQPFRLTLQWIQIQRSCLRATDSWSFPVLELLPKFEAFTNNLFFMICFGQSFFLNILCKILTWQIMCAVKVCWAENVSVIIAQWLWRLSDSFWLLL